MSTYFTITGHHTRKRWLVNIFDQGVALIEPHFWSISEYLGISYAGGAGKYYYGKWPFYLMLRVRFRIWRIENRWARQARRQAAIERIAAKHGGKPTADN